MHLPLYSYVDHLLAKTVLQQCLCHWAPSAVRYQHGSQGIPPFAHQTLITERIVSYFCQFGFRAVFTRRGPSVTRVARTPQVGATAVAADVSSLHAQSLYVPRHWEHCINGNWAITRMFCRSMWRIPAFVDLLHTVGEVAITKWLVRGSELILPLLV